MFCFFCIFCVIIYVFYSKPFKNSQVMVLNTFSSGRLTIPQTMSWLILHSGHVTIRLAYILKHRSWIYVFSVPSRNLHLREPYPVAFYIISWDDSIYSCGFSSCYHQFMASHILIMHYKKWFLRARCFTACALPWCLPPPGPLAAGTLSLWGLALGFYGSLQKPPIVKKKALKALCAFLI